MSEEKKAKKFKNPHTFVVVTSFIILATILTWLVPSGTFERALDETTGRTLVVPGTFRVLEHTPVSPAKMVMSIFDGMVNAADIIFFTFFSYGFMVMLIKVGAFDSGVGAMLRKLKDKYQYAMPIIAILFSLTGALFGLYPEVYGFVPIVMSLSVALGYDPLYGAIAILGGMAYRWFCYFCFMTLFLFCMCRYGRMVKANPEKSYVYGVHFPFISNTSSSDLIKLEFTTKHKISLALCASTVVIFAYGAIEYGWYFSELSAIFLVTMFIIGRINGQSISDTCNAFVEISKEILFAAFVIGAWRLAR